MLGHTAAELVGRKQFIYISKAPLHTRKAKWFPTLKSLSLSVLHLNDQIPAILLENFMPCHQFREVFVLGCRCIQSHKRSLR